jgi:1-aminocyclopropane-1-carboxylate deaminase
MPPMFSAQLPALEALMRKIPDPVNEEVCFRGFHFGMKRLDRIHDVIGGNKWFKLRYNLEAAVRGGFETILTFGGPWSNHLHAVAHAGRLLNLRTIGVVRGERPASLSATLQDCLHCGMQLEFISREAYRLKGEEDFRGWLHSEYGMAWVIPEGGSNFLGVNGCTSILSEGDRNTADLVCASAGTGATLAGLLLGKGKIPRITGFSALKAPGHIHDAVTGHLATVLGDREVAREIAADLSVDERWHFGGFGRCPAELSAFIREFERETGVPLDQIYTGKMMFGLIRSLENGELADDRRILVIHTGGLQGRRSLDLSGA